ncbi:hypothetical protein F66182_1794 [Fusarium sp. NRRL 66182]|nr:hypothetical protein F66182_1794 [Fusarium sp. NRRL 66182]
MPTQIQAEQSTLSKDEGSFMTISREFWFGEKQSPRPGQSSQRPQPEQSQTTYTSRFFSKPNEAPFQYPPLSPLYYPVYQAPRAAAPLDLPELGLSGSHSSSGSSLALQSRASNVSHMHSSMGKSRSGLTGDPERQKIALQNMAQNWNECIRIAEVEFHEANREITRLENELHYAGEALDMAWQDVSERDSLIQESEARCKKLQDEVSCAENEVQRLHVEVKFLRLDLENSQKNATAIHDMYREDRARMNEAIAEQQHLFSRARDLYNETDKELQKERGSRTAEVKALEQALEYSQKEREELKSCTERHRAEAQKVNAGNETAYFEERPSEESLVSIRPQRAGPKYPDGLGDFATVDVHAQGERFRRKVVVASPVLEAPSPAPPPSVAQERARRREGAAPRPILRSTISSMQDIEPARALTDHNQYNRPVIAKVGSTAGGINQEAVEQIRSVFVQPGPKRQAWDLPTVKDFTTIEDFTKEISSDNKLDATLSKKHSITSVVKAEDADPVPKRIKSEESQNPPEHKAQKDVRTPKQHRVIKTDSRKQKV